MTHLDSDRHTSLNPDLDSQDDEDSNADGIADLENIALGESEANDDYIPLMPSVDMAFFDFPPPDTIDFDAILQSEASPHTASIDHSRFEDLPEFTSNALFYDEQSFSTQGNKSFDRVNEQIEEEILGFTIRRNNHEFLYFKEIKQYKNIERERNRESSNNIARYYNDYYNDHKLCFKNGGFTVTDDQTIVLSLDDFNLLKCHMPQTIRTFMPINIPKTSIVIPPTLRIGYYDTATKLFQLSEYQDDDGNKQTRYVYVSDNPRSLTNHYNDFFDRYGFGRPLYTDREASCLNYDVYESLLKEHALNPAFCRLISHYDESARDRVNSNEVQAFIQQQLKKISSVSKSSQISDTNDINAFLSTLSADIANKKNKHTPNKNKRKRNDVQSNAKTNTVIALDNSRISNSSDHVAQRLQSSSEIFTNPTQLPISYFSAKMFFEKPNAKSYELFLGTTSILIKKA